MSAHPFSPALPRGTSALPFRRVWPLDVLVIEDDPSARRLLANVLRSEGHTCRDTATTKGAIDLLEQKRPDVILCDWELPGENGLELCRRTRAADDDTHYAYFIVMTGHVDAQRRMEAMEAGADDFQRKPIDLDELDARLVLASRLVALHRKQGAQTEALRRDSRRLYIASHTDALTGTANRLALEEELEAFRDERKRYGRRASAAVCDVDFFKQYNDAFGHLAGDEALRRIAETFRQGVRASDRLYRYGGEEFVILLREQDAHDAIHALDRLRSGVEALAIPARDGVLTISAGVAEFEPGDATGKDWLGRADAALYRAKAAGRNRVEVWMPPE